MWDPKTMFTNQAEFKRVIEAQIERPLTETEWYLIKLGWNCGEELQDRDTDMIKLSDLTILNLKKYLTGEKKDNKST